MLVCLFVANLFSYAITNFWVIITQVVQNFTIRGKIQPIQMPTFVSQLPMSQFKLITPEENINGTTLPISQLEQGVALCHWSTSIFILFVTTFLLATLKGSIKKYIVWHLIKWKILIGYQVLTHLPHICACSYAII